MSHNVHFSAIPGYLFRTPESVYESKSNPKNHCYCSPNLPEGWCTERDGIRMFDQCQFGAPGKIRPPNDLQIDFQIALTLTTCFKRYHRHHISYRHRMFSAKK